MKFILTLVTVAGCLLLNFTQAKAQSNTQTFSPSQLQAAEQYLIATGINTKFGAITDNIVEAFGNQMPEEHRAAYKDVMSRFMHKYYTWDNLKGELDKIYAAEFTEAELKQLAAFFNTPLGKKYGDKLVKLTQ